MVSLSAISRGSVTDWLITTLEISNFPVGDNDSPDVPWGWQGEPHGTESTFIPWIVVTPLTSQPQRLQAMGDTGREWTLPYNVMYAGMTRRHCERLADRMRGVLASASRIPVETPTGVWKIQKISCSTIGSTVKVGSPFPDHYYQIDTFDIWASKE